MPRDLVVFGEDWGGHPSSTQHIVSHLAADRRVVWVNSLGLRRPRLNARDVARAAAKLRSAVGPRPAVAKTPAPTNMRIVDPLAISWPGNPVADVINRRLVGARLRNAISDAGLREPVLWASLPTAAPLVGAIGESAVVYYCGDDFAALAGVDHSPVSRMERNLADRADLVIAASEPLANRFAHRPSLLAPHGVDFELFSTPAPRAIDLPEGPVAGFYGALADWIDVAAITEAARRLPHWRFVFVGPVHTDVSMLAAAPNVTLLGPRPHGSLPSYSQHWTVSMLPFRDNAQIRACNPLKLREYLAAGSPVVSSRFPAMAAYADCISVYGDETSLASAIQRAARDGSRNDVRRARVADDSWSACAAGISAALETL